MVWMIASTPCVFSAERKPRRRVTLIARTHRVHGNQRGILVIDAQQGLQRRL